MDARLGGEEGPETAKLSGGQYSIDKCVAMTIGPRSPPQLDRVALGFTTAAATLPLMNQDVATRSYARGFGSFRTTGELLFLGFLFAKNVFQLFT